ncbi:unnamed protein product [Anisakis simplex]|uniref:Uncharacterized protein n=1 Tax=Anisakis simplex TaxID=6269 RepID=A0A0M3K2H7_ANISI|nr:unnamed protein product [Anisakis simplex]
MVLSTLLGFPFLLLLLKHHDGNYSDSFSSKPSNHLKQIDHSVTTIHTTDVNGDFNYHRSLPSKTDTTDTSHFSASTASGTTTVIPRHKSRHKSKYRPYAGMMNLGARKLTAPKHNQSTNRKVPSKSQATVVASSSLNRPAVDANQANRLPSPYSVIPFRKAGTEHRTFIPNTSANSNNTDPSTRVFPLNYYIQSPVVVDKPNIRYRANELTRADIERAMQLREFFFFDYSTNLASQSNQIIVFAGL